MATFFWVGTSLGALIGFLHSVLVFRQQRKAVNRGLGRALYMSIWTFALWALFGAYVLFFYVLGGIAMLLSRLLPKAATR